MATFDLQPLIQRAQQGDEAAIGSLYERCAPLIYRYIYYRVSTTEDAEDLTAEVFKRMLEGLPRYRHTGAPFEAWLYRIAAARVVDFRRRQKRRPVIQLAETLEDSKPKPEEQVVQRLEVEELRRALRQLNDEQQTILLLRFVERKSHQEVADILGKSMTAVKSAQHRALVLLVSALGSEDKVRHYLRGGGND
ncbi:MAG: sigma-70 family RNA polymerase sigma factor [bacterium]|nr:sigma-70 family RNA polymerase sigma factor [bacterium]